MAVGVFFDVDSVRKDLRTMLEEGRAKGKPMPLVTKALDLYDKASAAGLGERNCSTLLPVLAQTRRELIGFTTPRC